jgi:hypothetical protein
MKKTLLFGASAILLLATSCGSDQPSQTLTYHVPGYNLAVDATTGDAVISQTDYICAFELYGGTAQVAVSDVTLPGGESLSFVASDMSFLSYQSSPYTLISVSTSDATLDKNIDLSNFSIKLYNGKNAIDVSVPGLTAVTSNNFYPVVGFNYGNYRVRTFWPDATYTGNTYTSYGGDEEFKNENMGYRVVMNLKDNRNYTADVYLLNAQFAPKAPVIQVIRLKGLNLEFGKSGIVVSGENVIPEMILSGDITGDETTGTTEDSYVPAPTYIFKEFKLISGGQLIAADINYKVGENYSARFSGSYLPSISTEN